MASNLFSLTIGQQVEFNRILAKAGLSKELVEKVIKKPESASVVLSSIFRRQNYLSKFNRLLYSLDQQAKYLKRLNSMLPSSLQIPEVFFDNLDTKSQRQQRIDDLEVLCVIGLGSQRDDVEYYTEIAKLIYPNSLNIIDERALGNFGELVFRTNSSADGINYFSGIYKKRINLVNNWGDHLSVNDDELYSGCISKKLSFDEVCQQYQYPIDGCKLAGLFAFGGCLLQDPTLMRLMDGVILPKISMPELECFYDDSYPLISSLTVEWKDNQLLLRQVKPENLDSLSINDYSMPCIVG